MLRLAHDAEGRRLLPTPDEAERARADALARKLRELGIDPAEVK